MTRYVEYLVRNPKWVKESIRKNTKLRFVEDVYQDIVCEAIEHRLDGPVSELLARQIHTWKVRSARQKPPCAPLHAGMDPVKTAPSETDTLDAESILESLPHRDREIMLMAMQGYTLREIARYVQISHQRVSTVIKQTIARLKEKYVVKTD